MTFFQAMSGALCYNFHKKLFHDNIPYLYSASVTGFSQTGLLLSGLGVRAMWLNQELGAAPCQCSTLGSTLTTSPGFKISISCPRIWWRPSPLVTNKTYPPV